MGAPARRQFGHNADCEFTWFIFPKKNEACDWFRRESESDPGAQTAAHINPAKLLVSRIRMLNMRPIEWLTVATSLLAIVCFVQTRPPSSTFWLEVAAALLLLLHVWLEGMHWQMAPAYLAVLLMLLVMATGLTSPILRLSCGIIAGAMAAASLVLSWVLPMFKLPAPTGRYPVGTRTLYLTDSNRMEMHEGARSGDREVVAQLWYPAATAKWKKAVYRRMERNVSPIHVPGGAQDALSPGRTDGGRTLSSDFAQSCLVELSQSQHLHDTGFGEPRLCCRRPLSPV